MSTKLLICFNLIFLISTTSLLPQLVNSVSYGPSLVSLTRWDRLVRGPTIFNPDTGRIISLEDYPNYSVVIPLAPDSSSATSNQVFISRRVSGPGEFSVEAPPGFGVMAVVQSLDLRVAEDTCNDFILFSDVEGGGAESTGTCGKVDIRDKSHSPQGLIGPRSFVSPSGKMKILFYHGFIWGLVRNFNFDIFDSSLNPDLKLEIAFTAYKECSSLNDTSSTSNATEDEPHLNLFASCAPSITDTKTCIRQELFCDRTINCAFSQDFASDENVANCENYPNLDFARPRHSSSPSSTTTTITVSTTSRESSDESAPASIEVTSTELPTESTTEPTTAANVETESGQGEKRFNGGIGTDAAGLIGLVRKFTQVRVTTAAPTPIRTVIIKGSSIQTIYNNQTKPTSVAPLKVAVTPPSVTTTTVIPQTSKMPVKGSELFVDIKSDPIEDPLVDGVSKEEAILDHDEGMSALTMVGIFSITAIVLILLGMLRIYYCYNKVIWNPHGNLKPIESPPETPNANLMRKMKAIAKESEEIFNEKKGKKEQPPSYEILFPLPEDQLDKEPSLKV